MINIIVFGIYISSVDGTKIHIYYIPGYILPININCQWINFPVGPWHK